MSCLPANPGAALAALLPTVVSQMSFARESEQQERPPRQLSDFFRTSHKFHIAIVIVVDGLGAEALHRYREIAPRLYAGCQASLSTVFPTTTAAALPAITTASQPGEHGLLGYKIYNEASRQLCICLSQWNELSRPASVQEAVAFSQKTPTTSFGSPPAPTLQTLADSSHTPTPWLHTRPFFCTTEGVSHYVIARSKHEHSGFTRATLAGAEYIGADTLADRFVAARTIAESVAITEPSSLIYLYIDELDKAGHKNGVGSDPWKRTLTQINHQFENLLSPLPSHTALFLTADHGMLTIAHRNHLVLEEILPQTIQEHIAHLGGEPRCRFLYLKDSATTKTVRDALSQHEGHRAWVFTREEALEASLFGPLHPCLLPRLPEVFLLARENIVYDSVQDSESAKRMLGQHGSLTNAERFVPLILAGNVDASSFLQMLAQKTTASFEALNESAQPHRA